MACGSAAGSVAPACTAPLGKVLPGARAGARPRAVYVSKPGLVAAFPGASTPLPPGPAAGAASGSVVTTKPGPVAAMTGRSVGMANPGRGPGASGRPGRGITPPPVAETTAPHERHHP
ncbi:hypothetical protein GCM10010347_56450 [Streptomyces cirratus]|uniref:Uncharacterized protein n=1 Tax=Streptomyces cirratus TaxID=68187 RepID=A0ABQ3F0L9_9ACTN|nr:hypothetical protein GCM10010347_56450 [Streptomyces cirratus]